MAPTVMFAQIPTTPVAGDSTTSEVEEKNTFIHVKPSTSSPTAARNSRRNKTAPMSTLMAAQRRMMELFSDDSDSEADVVTPTTARSTTPVKVEVDRTESRSTVDSPKRNMVQPKEGMTTIMVRNIPNKYTQPLMIESLNEGGFRGMYDFFYIPMDFKHNVNLGYAFINLKTPEDAAYFMNHFTTKHLTKFASNKVVKLEFGKMQGLSRNVEHFRNSTVMTDGVELDHRPSIFDSEGNRLEFPAPTASLKQMRRRYNHSKNGKK